MDSTKALYLLGKDKYEFELIYIDGDHHRDQVMIDSCLAWRLLRPGGIMIWDDYSNYCPDEPDENRPERAIDLFCNMVHPSLIESTGQQLIVRKQEVSHAIQENRQRRIYFTKGEQIHREAGEAVLR
jgi:predicted O-methyltransferase YrrM